MEILQILRVIFAHGAAAFTAAGATPAAVDEVFLQRLTCVSDVSTRGTALVPIEATVVKVFRFATLFDHSVRQRTQNSVHHSQMFAIVVRLKQRHTLEEFVNDAAERPNVARLTPTQLEDDFGSAVVTRRHNRGMMLVIECSGTKVDKANGGI